MASRRVKTRLGETVFDHGAQFFTAEDAGFQEQIRRWVAQNAVAPWPPAGPDAWVGVPAMNAPLKACADGLDVRWATRAIEIMQASPGWKVITKERGAFDAEAIVVALPAEQTADLIAGAAEVWAARARQVDTLPCWTALLAFAERLPCGADVLRGEHDSRLALAARNNAKPGRDGPEAWVLQASPAWSARNIEASSERIETELIEALSERLGVPLPETIARGAHRWRYAHSGADGSGALWDPILRLGVCGDWLVGSRVEGAWISGKDLGQRMAHSLGFSGGDPVLQNGA